MKKIIGIIMLMLSTVTRADITQQLFSFNQVFDVQWYISGGILHASGFNYLYASQPSNARLTSSQTNSYSSANDVIKFFHSTTNPGTYGLGVYDSTGTTLIRVLDNTGSFSALANGAIFYNGAGMWGTLFTTTQGYSIGGSGNFTITVNNPTTAQLQSYVPTTTQPLGAGQQAQTKTITGTSTTNSVSTSVSYGTTTYTISYVTRTVYTTNSAGNQIIQTFSDTITTPVTPVYTTTTTTPVTTTTYSDGSTTTSNGTPTSSTTTTYNYGTATTTYGTTPTSTTPWICCGGSAAPFTPNNTYIQQINNFNNRTTSDSQVYISQVGDANTITVNQVGSKNNSAYYAGNGVNNDITISQSATSNSQTNFSYNMVAGNSNNINITQSSTGGSKAAFVTATDNNNNITVSQTDAGSHYAEIGVTGGNKTVNLSQSGSANQSASIQLSGNPTSLTLQQTGTTANSYSIQFNCATVSGCSPINVKQGN